MFFDKIVKINSNSITITENISIVFQLFLTLIEKLQFIEKIDFSEFRIYLLLNAKQIQTKSIFQRNLFIPLKTS
jgi:hypothetical protein